MKERCSAKETYNVKEPTNRSHPISIKNVNQKRLTHTDLHQRPSHVLTHALNSGWIIKSKDVNQKRPLIHICRLKETTKRDH